MTCPSIVFVYIGGRPYYLDSALKSARLYAPKCPLVEVDGTELVSQGMAKKFTDYYQHYSKNPVQFELACLQRWFVLYSYCASHGIKHFWHLDNDILVFSDLNQNLPPVAMTRPLATFYCRDLSQLYAYCVEVLGLYIFPRRLEPFIELYRAGHTPGISDMVLANGLRPKMLNLCNHNSCGYFDANIAIDDHGFHAGLGTKTLRWHEGIPYAWHTRSVKTSHADYDVYTSVDSWVPLRTIHCWARKTLMEDYLEEARFSRWKAGFRW